MRFIKSLLLGLATCAASTAMAESLSSRETPVPAPWGPTPRAYLVSNAYEAMFEGLKSIESLSLKFASRDAYDVKLYLLTSWTLLSPRDLELCGSPCGDDDKNHLMITVVFEDGETLKKAIFINLIEMFERDPVKENRLNWSKDEFSCFLGTIEQEILYLHPGQPDIPDCLAEMMLGKTYSVTRAHNHKKTLLKFEF